MTDMNQEQHRQRPSLHDRLLLHLAASVWVVPVTIALIMTLTELFAWWGPRVERVAAAQPLAGLALFLGVGLIAVAYISAAFWGCYYHTRWQERAYYEGLQRRASKELET